MKLWQLLYGMIWLSFLQIILPIVLSPSSIYVISLHAILGLAVFGLAFYDNSMMQKLEVPFRLKTIIKSTRALAGAQLAFGLLLYIISNIYTLGDIANGVVTFIHVSIALAIITQASSVATAYDMWEEKEYNPPYTDPRLKSPTST
jgi:hypothetical protein